MSGKIVDRQQALAGFREYVAEYLGDENEKERIQLKIDHTYRVAKLCDMIAEAIGLEGEEREVAWLLGLLHDIGRFPQLRKYHTFIDSESIDHALLSTQLLFEEGQIRNFIVSDAWDQVIRRAILYHSAYRLPDGLKERMLVFCNLIRDADKIDILKINTDTPLTVILGPESAEAKYQTVTSAVMQDYMEEHAVFRKNNRTYLDHIVGYASLTFELIYPVSVEFVKKKGYADQILSFEVENPTGKEQLVQLRKKMQEFMERSRM